jgi:hypothetical protein
MNPKPRKPEVVGCTDLSYHKRRKRQWVTHFKAMKMSEKLKYRHNNNVGFVKSAGVYLCRA